MSTTTRISISKPLSRLSPPTITTIQVYFDGFCQPDDLQTYHSLYFSLLILLLLYSFTSDNFLVYLFLFYLFSSTSRCFPLLMTYISSFFGHFITTSRVAASAWLPFFLLQLLCIPFSKKALFLCVITRHMLYLLTVLNELKHLFQFIQNNIV